MRFVSVAVIVNLYALHFLTSAQKSTEYHYMLLYCNLVMIIVYIRSVFFMVIIVRTREFAVYLETHCNIGSKNVYHRRI